jgi:hypothetical protein
MLIEALNIVEETGSKSDGESILEMSAGLATCFEDSEHAARLWGAAEAHCEKMGYRREPVDEAFLAPLIAKARDALGAEAFAAAEAAGRALSYEAALAEARAWLQESTSDAARNCREAAQ